MACLASAISGRTYAASGSDCAYTVGDFPDPTRCGLLGQLFNWTRDRFAAASFLIELPPTLDSPGGGSLPTSAIDGIVAEQRAATLCFSDDVIAEATP